MPRKTPELKIIQGGEEHNLADHAKDYELYGRLLEGVMQQVGKDSLYFGEPDPDNYDFIEAVDNGWLTSAGILTEKGARKIADRRYEQTKLSLENRGKDPDEIKKEELKLNLKKLLRFELDKAGRIGELKNFTVVVKRLGAKKWEAALEHHEGDISQIISRPVESVDQAGLSRKFGSLVREYFSKKKE